TFAWPRQVMAKQYQCADGRYVQHHGMFERFVHQTCTAANRPEWIESAVSLIGREVDAGTIALWVERFAQMFRQRTAVEWEEAISAAGGAWNDCKTIDEWLGPPPAVIGGRAVEVG